MKNWQRKESLPGGPKVDGLAVPVLVQYFRRDVSEASGERGELLAKIIFVHYLLIY